MSKRLPAIFLLGLAACLLLNGCVSSSREKTKSVYRGQIHSLYGEKCNRMLQIMGNPTTIELTECIYELSFPENPRQILTVSVEIKDDPQIDFKERVITGVEYRCQGLEKSLNRLLETNLWQALKNAPPPDFKTYPAGKDLGFSLQWKNLKIDKRIIPLVNLQGFIPQTSDLGKNLSRQLLDLLAKKGRLEIYREGGKSDEE